MALEESDLDRIADKIELSVTRAINAAMEKHVHDTHEPCKDACDGRLERIEEAQRGLEMKVSWGAGLLAGLAILWELVKRKLGA